MASPLAFVFPGQGSQTVGMGRAVYEASARARAVFEEADRILGYKLSEICFNGPADRLDDTRVAQPAILTTSVALLEALAEDAANASTRLSDGHEPRGVAALPDDLRPSFVAGHSLGEFSALVALGVLALPDAVDEPTALGLLRALPALERERARHDPDGQGPLLACDLGDDRDAERDGRRR